MKSQICIIPWRKLRQRGRQEEYHWNPSGEACYRDTCYSPGDVEKWHWEGWCDESRRRGGRGGAHMEHGNGIVEEIVEAGQRYKETVFFNFNFRIILCAFSVRS